MRSTPEAAKRTMVLDAQFRPLASIDARTEQAWTDLGRRTPEPNPFFEPIVAQARARHLGMDISVLSVERGSDVLFCLPLRIQTFRWGRLPLRAWTAWDPLGVPLVDGADPAAVVSAAVARLARVGGPGFLVLDLVPTDGPAAAALDAATRGRRPAWVLAHTYRARPALYRREDGNYIGATLHPKRRRKQGNRRRNLEKRLGAALQLVDENGRTEAIDRLLDIEVRGWKGRIGSAVLCRPHFTRYFREMCMQFAAHGRLQVLSMQAAGTTVAMKADIVAGDALFGVRTAFEQEFGEASPGVEIEIAAIAAFHASGARMWDSATNHLKNPQDWLWPDRRPLARVVLSLGGLLGRAASSRVALAAQRWLA